MKEAGARAGSSVDKRPASEPDPRVRWARLWACDTAFAAIALFTLVGTVQLLEPPGARVRSLWALGLGLTVLTSALWVLLLRRARGPIYAAASLRRGPSTVGSVRAMTLRAGYQAAVRLGVVSLWGRAGLGTACSALLALLGWSVLGLDRGAALLLFWGGALLGPHLSALCSIPHEALAQRWLDALVRSAPAAVLGEDAELRRQLDTYPGRLAQVALISGGIGGAGALAVSLVVAQLPIWAPRGLSLALLLPPLLLLSLAGWLLLLRSRTARIEGSIAELSGLRLAGGREKEIGYAALHRALALLPQELALAQLLAWLLPLGVALALLAAVHRLPLVPLARGLSLLTLPLLAGALYSLAWQTAILQPLSHLIAAAPGSPLPSQRTPDAVPGTPSLRRLSAAAAALMVVLLGIGLELPTLGLILLAVAGMLGGAWGVGRLVQPVAALRAQTVALARGELAAEPPAISDKPATRDAAQLSAALAILRQSLRERLQASAQAQATLESEVATRTAELRQRTAELEAALAALADTQAELLQAEQLASIGRLVAGIAHEINNPVNAVVNTAAPLVELLYEIDAALRRPPRVTRLDEIDPLLAEMAEMLAVLDRASRRTSEIVRALRDYSQGGAEPKEPAAPVALHPLIDEAWELVQDPIKPQVSLDRDYGELSSIPGLAGKLRQVFINLMSNALYALRQRAVSEGPGYRPRLQILTRAAGERAFVEVTDNGVGMPQEVRLRAFDPFFTTKDINDGSGLGLSIVHGIVQRHRGDVRVRSQPGEGTTFTLSLPLTQAEP